MSALKPNQIFYPVVGVWTAEQRKMIHIADSN